MPGLAGLRGSTKVEPTLRSVHEPAAGGGSSDREKDVATVDSAIDTKKYGNSNKTRGIVPLASHKRVKRKE